MRGRRGELSALKRVRYESPHRHCRLSSSGKRRAVAHSGSGSTFRIGFAAGSIPTLYTTFRSPIWCIAVHDSPVTSLKV